MNNTNECLRQTPPIIRKRLLATSIIEIDLISYMIA